MAGSKSWRASWRTSAAIRTVVSGVRSSCETSETNRRWTRDRSSSCRIWPCSDPAIWLNDVAELGQVVLPHHGHAFLEPAGGEPLRGPGGHPDRRDDLAGHQPGDPAEQQDQRDARDGERALDQREGVGLLAEREQVVQLVGTHVRQRERSPDREPGDRRPVVCVRDLGVGGGLSRRLTYGLAQGERHARGGDLVGAELGDVARRVGRRSRAAAPRRSTGCRPGWPAGARSRRRGRPCSPGPHRCARRRRRAAGPARDRHGPRPARSAPSR